MDNIHQKYQALQMLLESCQQVAVAFSGGVDSTFLLYAAHAVLGDCVIAVTADSAFFPRREQSEAYDFCREHGIRQITFQADVLQDLNIIQNPPDRCYLCKRLIFGSIQKIAAENGITQIAEGSNLDDLGDYRPGMRAIAELGILSPLRDAELTKQEIRQLSKELGLPTWEKPSFACLASRIPYGDLITDDKLRMAERAEAFLLAAGFRQVRVRIHGEIARIEVLPEDFERLLSVRQQIVAELKSIGFRYISLDLTGYRTGSLNEALNTVTNAGDGIK